MLLTLSKSLALASSLSFALAATYGVTDNVSGNGFDSWFDYFTAADPTHGRVVYVNQQTAKSQNLTYATGDSFVIRSDSRTYLNPSGPGRNSVRLTSRKFFSRSVAVFNIRHMPQGCGTWPALWSYADPWPNVGEIDILEGVNNQGPNQLTLHTSPGCTMPANRQQTGIHYTPDCNAYANSNTGCAVRDRDARSYGVPFNNNGGGFYALERTGDTIRLWFWPRGASTPSDVLNGANTVNTDAWGTPTALFPTTSECNIASKFGPHNIVINLTFCGDWAGQQSLYAGAGCPGTCVDYVNNNPSAFTNAYWEFLWIKAYA